MPELLLELLSEEIPARMQTRAAEDLKRLATDGLKKAGLDFESAEAFVTPRRLALVVDGLPERSPDISEERRGPRVDAPDKAVEGFKNSLPDGAKVETRETEKGEFYFALVEQKGQKTADFLPDLFDDVFQGLPWPKSMRWGDKSQRWVRPLHTVLCIFDGKTVNGVAFADEPAGNMTSGHSFLAAGPINDVQNFTDYAAKLKAAHVILDGAERRAAIETGAKNLAKKAGLALTDDPALLDEVTGLVEWPVVLMGEIDGAFMGLPEEVLTTAMRHHQKYFALSDKKGGLAPKFIVVANTETSDKGKVVVAGNERVLRARLADAKFFWDSDCKRTLDSRVDDLGGRVFHAKLGSLLDKAARVEKLAGRLAEACGADAGDAKRAGRLAKADLSTEMVVEFPELQGVMGRYYALHDGEEKPVAAAVAEHYSPKGPGDSCPSAPVSVAVALADKLDSLIGFWAIDEKPTGSKDPFALRRAALGVIRLILENGLRIPLAEFIRKGWFLKGELAPGVSDSSVPEPMVNDLLAFFADRLKVHLREKGVPHDHIDAVFALGGEGELVRLLAQVEALGAFLKTADGGNLLTAYKRAANIVRIEEKKDGKRYDGDVNEKLLDLKEERRLHTELKSAVPKIAQALKGENFHTAMELLAGLRKPVDDFFDHVTVNCEDGELRENRLRLLSEISSALDDVADFSRIEGGER